MKESYVQIMKRMGFVDNLGCLINDSEVAHRDPHISEDEARTARKLTPTSGFGDGRAKSGKDWDGHYTFWGN